MAVDKPTVHLSINALKKEVANPDPFRVSLSGSKIITFPDVFAMESTEAEDFFDGITSNSSVWEALEKWLSKPDLAALKAEKLSVRQLKAVTEAAMQYYEQTVGSAGNGPASAS